MGTNYYAVKAKPSLERAIHVGKASAGWLFLFQDCEYWHTYPQVKRWLHENITLRKEYVLMNEYEEIVDVEDFIELVQQHQEDKRCKKNPDNFKGCRDVDGYRFVDEEFS